MTDTPETPEDSAPKNILFFQHLSTLRQQQKRIFWLCALVVALVVAVWLSVVVRGAMMLDIAEQGILLLLPVTLVVVAGAYAHRAVADRLFHAEMLEILANRESVPQAGAMVDEEKVAGLISDVQAAMDRAEKHFADLHTVLDDGNAQFSGLDQQIQALQPLLEDYRDKASAIRQEAEKQTIETQNVQREAFLQSAQYILQDLYATTFEMFRQLDGQISEGDWKRFNGGDRHIFARTLLKKPQPLLIKQLEQRLQDDTALRTHVQRYCSEFTRLLDSSAQLDREGFLYGLMITSDVGKLYLLLQMAQGKHTIMD